MRRRPPHRGDRHRTVLALQLAATLIFNLLYEFLPPVCFTTTPISSSLHPSVLFAVFLTTRGSQRIPVLNAYINRSLTEYPESAAFFEYAYLNHTSTNSTHFLTPHGRWIDRILSVSPKLSVKSREMIAMDFFSLSYFLEETAWRWFFRGTDDTILNFRRLPSFISALEAEFDPERDAVVRGDCVVYKKSPVYLQGGAGYLCSRAAARALASGLYTFLDLFETAEDTTTGPFLDAIGIGVRNACSGAFMGHGQARVEPRTPSSTISCPARNLSRWPVPRHLERLRDILVYHKKDNSGRRLQAALKRADAIFNAHPSRRWYTVDNFWPRMCTAKEEV